MMNRLLPIYQKYESEISQENIIDIFPPDEFEENFEYFTEYFSWGITLIMEVDKKYAGFVSYHLVSDCEPGYSSLYLNKNPKWGHIKEIYVEKDLRYQQLGKKMVEKAEKELQNLNACGAYLVDVSSYPKFWNSMGYVDTGKIVKEEGNAKIFEKLFN